MSNPGENDLVTRLLSLADCDARAGEPLGKCMREAAAYITAAEARIAELEADRDQYKEALLMEHRRALSEPENKEAAARITDLEDYREWSKEHFVDMVKRCDFWLATARTQRERAETAEARLSEAMKALAKCRDRSVVVMIGDTGHYVSQAVSDRLSTLEGALQPFAAHADEYTDETPDSCSDWPTFEVGDFRRARAALRATRSETK